MSQVQRAFMDYLYVNTDLASAAISFPELERLERLQVDRLNQELDWYFL